MRGRLHLVLRLQLALQAVLPPLNFQCVCVADGLNQLLLDTAAVTSGRNAERICLV
jgi:hypothetical protein